MGYDKVVERLSRVAMIPVAPVLFVQGKRLRRDTPILPDAALPWHGSEAGENPLRLLVLGDSTAVGVGTDTQLTGLPGNLARELHDRWSRGVDWIAIGESGATSRDIIERFLPIALEHEFDFVFLTIGANDALKIRTRGAFSRDVRSILSQLRDRNPDAVLMMSSLPAFSRFELLPQPLKHNLYLHSSSLESGARAVVATFDNAFMSPKPPPYTEGFFASDRFHPSSQGYRDWARFAIDDAFANGQLR
jgi:lysophospholipase L1-like esterase